MNLHTASIYNLLFIDIETVSQQAAFIHLSDEWQKRWWLKIAKIMPETSPEDSYLQRAGIMAEFGKIICISMGYFFKNAEKETCFKIKTICGDNEKELLLTFIELTQRFSEFHSKVIFAGHNIREFDIPFLCRRMLVHGLPIPAYLSFHGAKPWEIEMVDTLQLWRFGDYKHYISLDLLAGVLNVPTSKTDIDGSMVHEVYYEEKDLQRIANYCEKDVVVVANIVLRFHNLPLIKEENILK